jgi:phage terminase small subunit
LDIIETYINERRPCNMTKSQELDALAKHCSVKERKLVQGKVAGLTHVKAYDAAGYSPGLKTSSKNTEVNTIMKKPHNKAYFEALTTKTNTAAESELVATASEVKEMLTAIMRGQVPDWVALPGKGVVERPTPTGDRIRAGELLGKHFAMFTDNKTVTGSLEHGIVFVEDLEDDDEELEEL